MAEENKNFQLEIITPDRVFYKGEASMVEFTSVDGEMGVYKHHIPLTTVLAPGIVTVTESGGKKHAAVHAGFVQILGEKVTFLAEIAEWPDEIDVNRAQAAKARAEERLRSHRAEIDVARAEIALKKALVRLDVRQ
ncbi:F0F1 ATP synthase subunit epsilon [Petralouisia muris]|jgi:F-type H+-transporting ATPase subunit epsilon|uniref:F0F1 ATP synthase subunit epsilon n=1 Tax=Petralouisia muris TaxID=3032872 RepID=A0AC61RUK6_9FIRM|nr:F0F1 ATP synthase subunit epsilon [Petralouisia muris]TGY95564.1 F0F1 ATP synthase subunit epsilon [Petralouisia muris]